MSSSLQHKVTPEKPKPSMGDRTRGTAETAKPGRRCTHGAKGFHPVGLVAQVCVQRKGLWRGRG